MGQMLVGAVDVVAEERATLAAFFPVLGEHEVVGDQLAVVAKQVSQLQFAVRALEVVVLVDFHPRQGAAFSAEAIALFGEGFFVF